MSADHLPPAAPPPPPPAPARVPAWRRPWQVFRQRHLHDYPDRAALLWLAIVAGGSVALVAQLSQLLQHADASMWAAAALAVALAAAASRFALRLPHSGHSVSAADVFIFGALVAVGPPAATLAAGVEGWVGTRRNSRRLSSWIASPAANMLAMALCGAAYEALLRGGLALGLSAEAAAFVALCAAAPVLFVATTTTLMALMALKRHAPMQPLDWLADNAWTGALYLFSACFAGLMHLGAQRFGPAVLAAAVAVVFTLVLLLRVSFARHERERAATQAQLAAAEHDAAVSHARYSAAFDHAAIGMAVVRTDGETLRVNHALGELLGRPRDSLLGRPFCDFIHDADLPLFRRRAADVLSATERSFSVELRLLHAHRGTCWAALHCSPFADPDGNGQSLIYQVLDITSRQQAEQRLQHIAYHDTLTDLANRLHFQEQLALAVERSRTQPDARFAVLFIDLDRFKMVNDSYGHHAGNELLRSTAERLRAGVRPSDLVARLGGDEFAVLLDGVHDTEAGLQLARRLLASVSEPLVIAGSEVLPGASMGITFSDLGYRTVDELLRDADLAMYEAKAGGRGRVAVFDQSMHERVAQKLTLENDLRHAIGEGQLSLHFQPIYELRQQRLAGFEALMRWTHPTHGPISPAKFIALAEESGHISALTDWVIDQAIGQLARWRNSPAEHRRRLTINVNISSRDLSRPALVEHVRQTLLRHAVPPAALTLEITESTLMGRLEAALATMAALRTDGVRFSIDDFGTGYSSLAYLGTLPIDSLKIDRSFVTGLGQRGTDQEIVRTIVQLGHTLDRRVVAEGIETAEQLAALRALGVDMGQGYLLSRPLAAAQADELLMLSQPV